MSILFVGIFSWPSPLAGWRAQVQIHQVGIILQTAVINSQLAVMPSTYQVGHKVHKANHQRDHTLDSS